MLNEFIHAWAEKHKGTYFDDRYRTLNIYAWHHFWAAYLEHNSQLTTSEGKPVKPIGKDRLKSEFERWTGDILPKAALEDLQKKLTYIGESNLPAETIQAVTGKQCDLDIACFKHWLWQVKRKLFDLPVKDHLFVMLFEPDGGSGKSTFIERMTEPLRDYCLSWNLAAVNEEKNFVTISQNFIVILDEMAKPGKVDADVLKHQITATYNDGRPLYSNGSAHVKQQCSFIGASNKPLDTLIIDSANMRRFWQIDCLPKMDWDFINGLDPWALWRSIDENNPEGFTRAVVDRLSVVQKSMATPDIVKQFVEERSLKIEENGFSVRIPVQTLYRDFRSFCTESGVSNTIPTKNSFSRLLKGQKLEDYRTTQERGFIVSSANRIDVYPRTIESKIDEICGGTKGDK